MVPILHYILQFLDLIVVHLLPCSIYMCVCWGEEREREFFEVVGSIKKIIIIHYNNNILTM